MHSSPRPTWVIGRRLRGAMPDGCDMLGVQDIDQEQKGDHDDGEYDYRNPQSAFSLDQPVQGERIGTCKTEFAVLAGLRLLRADAAAVWAGLRKHSVRHFLEITLCSRKFQWYVRYLGARLDQNTIRVGAKNSHPLVGRAHGYTLDEFISLYHSVIE
jgi:hypothetical protein